MRPRKLPPTDPLAALVKLTGRLGSVKLADVDAEIEEAEHTVAMLRRVRAMVEIAQGKVEAVPEAEYRVRLAGAAGQKCSSDPASSPRTRRTAVGGGEWVNPNRVLIAKYLIEHGPQRFTDIARGTGIKKGSMAYYVYGHEWFRKTVDGLYDVSPIGRAAVENQRQLMIGDARERRKRERNERAALLELRAIGTKLEDKL